LGLGGCNRPANFFHFLTRQPREALILEDPEKNYFLPAGKKFILVNAVALPSHQNQTQIRY